MKTVIAKLSSASPYSQSRLFTKIEVPALEKESHGDYDTRNWRFRQHFDSKGQVYIPPMALKNALMEVAQYLGEKIPGKGNATWTKHFTAGILCTDPAFIGVHKDDTKSESFMCHADGKRSCGTRVLRTFPVIPSWKAKVTFLILDETITKEIFQRYLEEAGKFIGIGRFRPRNGGFYGRFAVESIDWK